MTQKAQTYTSFSDKWNNNKSLFLKETLRENSDIFNWILTRNGFQNADELSTYLQSKKKILDAGCGNGNYIIDEYRGKLRNCRCGFNCCACC